MSNELPLMAIGKGQSDFTRIFMNRVAHEDRMQLAQRKAEAEKQRIADEAEDRRKLNLIRASRGEPPIEDGPKQPPVAQESPREAPVASSGHLGTQQSAAERIAQLEAELAWLKGQQQPAVQSPTVGQSVAVLCAPNPADLLDMTVTASCGFGVDEHTQVWQKAPARR
jgi:hypothetical protein